MISEMWGIDLFAETGLQPSDRIVRKRQWGPFYGANLELQLRRRCCHQLRRPISRPRLIRATRSVFAERAMSSVTAGAHNFNIRTTFPRMGSICSVAQILGRPA